MGRMGHIRRIRTHFSSADTIKQWVSRQTRHLFAHGMKKLAAKPGLLLFIPGLGLEKIGIHFRADDEAIFHSPSLRLSRASNSSHGIELEASFS